VSTDVAGGTALNGGSVTTTGAQTYADPVALGANTTLTSTGAAGTITLSNTVDSSSATARNLTVQTQTGRVRDYALGMALGALLLFWIFLK
jgi:hypothetical protein